MRPPDSLPATFGLLACHLWTRPSVYLVISAVFRNCVNHNDENEALAAAGVQGVVFRMDNMLAWLPCEPSVSFRGMEEPKAYPISGSFASTSRWFDVGLTLADRAAARQSRRGAILIVTTTSGAWLQAISTANDVTEYRLRDYKFVTNIIRQLIADANSETIEQGFAWLTVHLQAVGDATVQRRPRHSLQTQVEHASHVALTASVT